MLDYKFCDPKFNYVTEEGWIKRLQKRKKKQQQHPLNWANLFRYTQWMRSICIDKNDHFENKVYCVVLIGVCNFFSKNYKRQSCFSKKIQLILPSGVGE